MQKNNKKLVSILLVFTIVFLAILPPAMAQVNTPANITVTPGTTNIMVSWEEVKGSTGYELEIDGKLESVSEAVYVNNNLLPGTQHTYRIRAKNGTAASSWSPTLTAQTKLEEPKDFKLSDMSNGIILTWYPVEGASGYDIEINGKLETVIGSVYMHGDLAPGSQHIYKVRAKNALCTSTWSDKLVKSMKLDIPSNIKAISKTNSTTVSWGNTEGAKSYDIEVDGIVITDVDANTYFHSGLKSDTELFSEL